MTFLKEKGDPVIIMTLVYGPMISGLVIVTVETTEVPVGIDKLLPHYQFILFCCH